MATNMLIYQKMFSTSHILNASTGGNNGGSGGNSGGSGGSQGGPSSSSGSHAASEHKKDGEKIVVNNHIDQTMLKPGTRWDDVRKVIVDAFACDFPAVCIPPAFVKEAKVFL